jgi:hypothetical protein
VEKDIIQPVFMALRNIHINKKFGVQDIESVYSKQPSPKITGLELNDLQS